MSLVTLMYVLPMVFSLRIHDQGLTRGKSGNMIFPTKLEQVPITGTAPLFFLHLLKQKPTYVKIEKITTTPVTADCICVPYYLCDINQTIITDGVGVIDVRFRRCTGDLEVCCYPPRPTPSMQPIVTPTVTTPTTPPTTPTTPPTTPTTPPTTPTTPPTTPTTPPTTPTTPPTTPTTPPTTPTTPPTRPTTQPIPTDPPVVFPTQTPTTAPPTAPPTGLPGFYCICVPAWQCDPSGIVLTGGEGIINPRQQLGVCPSADQVCCRLPLVNIGVPTNPPVVSPTTAPGQTQICFVCGNAIQCINAIALPGGTGIINPRLTYPIQTCPVPNAGCCPGINTVDGNAIAPGIGMLKNPGTPQACYCVKTWWCTEGNAITVDGLGIVDPRFSACANADEVCCRPGGIDYTGFRGLKSDQGGYIVNTPLTPTPNKAVCGIQDTIFAPDTPYPPDSGKTYFAQFPWMVALLTQQSNGQFLFQCGASLITSRAVLTAAHCVTNRENGKLLARFGQWDLENPDQIIPYEEMEVQTIITHPLYYSGALYHDISVLIFEKPVTYNANIAPICLPQQGMNFAAGTRCFGTGWGRNSFGTQGKYQAELRKVDVPIVSRSDCQTRLRSTRLGQYFQLHGSFICAGGEPNRDTCQGDGGGPLACPTATGQFVQAGIVSWGIGCGASNVPAVYASVSQHRQWIDQQLATYGAQ